MGLAQLEDDSCPLCNKQWSLNELKAHLLEKRKAAESAKLLKSDLDKICVDAEAEIRNQNTSLNNLATVLPTDQDALKKKILQTIEDQNQKSAALNCCDLQQINAMFTASSIQINIKNQPWFTELENYVATLPESNKEEVQYEKLMSVQQQYEVFVKNQVSLLKVNKRIKVVEHLRDRFESTRVTYLKGLYQNIETEFSGFYGTINDNDEPNFKVKLKPEGSSLDLKVPFYNQGMHPPHALHSEGHQDIMGVCLYLSLMKQLKGPEFTFCMLDDVMMSIDSSHRLKLCEVLKNEFPDTQFIITTHDRFWAEHLSQVKVVKKANRLFFRTWSLESGPVFDSKDIWEYIIEKIEDNQLIEGAAKLRNLCEQDFAQIASNLRAQITYRSSD